MIEKIQTILRDLVKKKEKYWKEIIFCCGIMLVAIDTFFVHVTLISLGLFAIAISPWLMNFFHKIELPGGVHIEMRDLKRAEQELDAAGLITDPVRPQASYLEIGDRDPNLALAGLRIEIERRLNQILEAVGEDNIIQFIDRAPSEGRKTQITRKRLSSMEYVSQKKKTSFFTILSMTEKISILDEMKILNHNEAMALRDLIPLLNKAAHGFTVDRQAYDWATEIAPGFLSALEEKAMHAPLGEERIAEIAAR